MFVPRQALERIRQKKKEKEEVKSISEDVDPLFPSGEEKNQEFDKRISSLQLMVSRLNEQLSNSTDIISKLKRENSNLQTQILKLQYENSQLKGQNMYSELRNNHSQKRLSPQYNTVQDQQSSIQAMEKQIETIRKTDFYQPTVPEKQIYSLEVQEILQQIKKEPIQSILHKKEYNFRALKASTKQIQSGNKYLKELLAIEKQYHKTMKKPVLVIKLDDADFQ